MKHLYSLLLALAAACAALPVPSTAQTTSTACGGTSQPRCQITAPADQATTDQTKAWTDNISAWNTYAQSQVNVASNRFTWSFIPNIPTAACVNPMVPSPNGGAAVMMDVCSYLDVFRPFINGVLAFFCLLGCVQQIRAALAVN